MSGRATFLPPSTLSFGNRREILPPSFGHSLYTSVTHRTSRFSSSRISTCPASVFCLSLVKKCCSSLSLWRRWEAESLPFTVLWKTPCPSFAPLPHLGRVLSYVPILNRGRDKVWKRAWGMPPFPSCPAIGCMHALIAVRVCLSPRPTRLIGFCSRLD